MLIPKADRNKILTYLFNEGVMVAKKDFYGTHPDVGVRNLYVIKLMQSLTSKKYVKTSFNWNHYYYFLNNEGIEYLRELLQLDEDVVPLTLQQRKRPERRGESSETEGRPEGRGVRKEGGYRRDESYGRGSTVQTQTE